MRGTPPNSGYHLQRIVHTDGGEDKHKLLLIVDSMDAIRDEVSLASFIAGFKLAWGISRELEADGLYSYDEEEMTQPWRRSQEED